jgi:hypothetical protein
VDNVHVVWAARGGSSSYKTLFFRAIFEGSWCPRLDEVACVPRFMKIWRWRPFFLPPLLLSSHLDFHIDPLKIQEQPFNLLVLQIWSLTFLLWFFFILNNLLNLNSDSFDLYFLCLESFFQLILFYNFILFFFIFNPFSFDRQFFSLDKFLF